MNLGGPQSNRDKSWVRKPAELSGDREDLMIDHNAEKQVSGGAVLLFAPSLLIFIPLLLLLAAEHTTLPGVRGRAWSGEARKRVSA